MDDFGITYAGPRLPAMECIVLSSLFSFDCPMFEFTPQGHIAGGVVSVSGFPIRQFEQFFPNVFYTGITPFDVDDIIEECSVSIR